MALSQSAKRLLWGLIFGVTVGSGVIATAAVFRANGNPPAPPAPPVVQTAPGDRVDALLDAWASEWTAAVAELNTGGDVGAARALLSGVSANKDRAYAINRTRCLQLWTSTLSPLANQIEPWVEYAESVDSLSGSINPNGGRDGAAYLANYDLLARVTTAPDGCPEPVCSEARASIVASQTEVFRPMIRGGRRALEGLAEERRRGMASDMDGRITGTGIDGTIRTSGRRAQTLELRYALCGRPVAESVFLSSRDALAESGFTWVGCRSSFRRYGWDLSPPDLEAQRVSFELRVLRRPQEQSPD